MKSKTGLLLSAASLLILGCSWDDDNVYIDIPDQILEERLIELYGSTQDLILPSSMDLDLIPSDPNNPLTKEKIALGKFLFHETGFGLLPEMEIGKNTYSCATCHHVKAGFQSGVIQGIGEGGVGFGLRGEARIASGDYPEDILDVQPIRTPSVLNVAFQDVMLWNGQFGAVGTNLGTEASWTIGSPKENNFLGFEGVETQAIAALSVHRQEITSDIINASPYKDMFDMAFPNIPESERYTKITAGLAIAAYERTLFPNKAPFQEWLKGSKQAMSKGEKEGAMLFFEKGQCYTCHSGPGLNGMDFYALGIRDLSGNNVHRPIDEVTKRGRGGFTGKLEDDYKFKTPQLYNLRDVQFFGHGGSFRSVREIIIYKNNALPENIEIGIDKISPLFTPLDLTEREISLLTYFVEVSLYDSFLQRYVPESLLSGNCFPNADFQSMQDLDCE